MRKMLGGEPLILSCHLLAEGAAGGEILDGI